MHSVVMICLGLAGFLVFVQLYVLVAAFSRLVKVPLRAALVTLVERAAMGDSATVLDTARAQLEQLGFQYALSLRTRSPAAVEGMPHGFVDVFYHAQHAVYAQVYVASMPTPHQLCTIVMSNSFADGKVLLTINGNSAELLVQPARTTLVDVAAHAKTNNAAPSFDEAAGPARGLPDAAAQLACHIQARTGFAAAVHPAAAYLDDAKAYAREALPSLAREGKLYRRGGPDADPVFGMRPALACRLAWGQYRAALRALKKQPVRTAPDFGEAALIAQRGAFVRTLCLLRGLTAPAWFRHAAFAASAALFLGTGAWLWGVVGALTIAAVLLLHEAGHWAAMKLSGFRDVQVFFVPGMGAATSGEKDEAHPFTHLLVYLAGPLPGLLLALAMLAWVASGPAQQDAAWYPALLSAAFVALLINALNLLPALPLDGGRIVELFLFGRLPWMRFVFALASGAVLLGAGVYTDDPVLCVLGTVMLFAARHHYQVARAAALLLKASRGRAPSAGITSASARLHAFLSRPAFDKWSFQTKVGVGLALLPRLRARLPSARESAVALAIYAACALLPLLAAAALMLSRPAQMDQAIKTIAATLSTRAPGAVAPGAAARFEAEAAWERDEQARRAGREAAIAAAATPAARIAALQDAFNDASDFEETEEAIRFGRLLHAATDPEGTRERAHAAMLLAGALAGRDGADPADAEVDNLWREADFILRGRIADHAQREDVLLLGEAMAQRADAQEPDQRFLAAQEVLALYTAHLPATDLARAKAHRSLARALHLKGLRADAEREMRTMLASLPESVDWEVKALRGDFAWMLAAYGKLEEAERVVLALRASGAADALGRRGDDHAVLWLHARHKGDWKTARQHAQAVAEAGSPPTAGWLRSLFAARPLPDLRARLMLIEAARALGDGDEADALVAVTPRRAGAPLVQKYPPCRIGQAPSWRGVLDQALLAIERRELHCTPSAPRPDVALSDIFTMPVATDRSKSLTY